MKAPKIRIRDVESSDLEGLVELYRQLVGDAPDAAPADADSAARILRVVIEDPARSLLIAELQDNNRVVGTIDLLIVSNITHQGRPWAIVENMVVDEAHRRFGLGRLLMEEAIGRARAVDCYKIQLLSKKVRVQAHAFYRSLNFEESAVGLRLYL